MLPNDPSELIRLAIADLERAERDDVDMGSWHEHCGEVCEVCLAGAVMAWTLGADTDESLIPQDFSDGVRDKLLALDYFRAGDICEGLGLLGIKSDLEDVDIYPYWSGPERFKRDMLIPWRLTLLPNDPSELIRLAIADLEKVERSHRYRVDMRVWHEPYRGVCSVCLAGAVMAATLGTTRSQSLIYRDFSDEVRNKLLALDYFRIGSISKGFKYLGIESDLDNVPICPYDDEPDQFKRDMLELADTLETLDD